MKKVLIAILLFGIIGLGVAYYLYNKTPDNFSSAKPAFELSASAVFDAFSTDETAANTKYLDQIISVEGKVTEIQIEDGQTNVMLETGDLMGRVVCEMDQRNLENGLNLSEGEVVKIIGLCTGYLMDVQLQRAAIVKK